MKENDIVWPGQEEKHEEQEKQKELRRQEDKKNIWKTEQVENKRKPVLDHAVTFSINPRKIMKGLFIIAMIFGVFFLGRMSTEEFSIGIPSISGLSVGVDSEVVADIPVEAEVEPEAASAEGAVPAEEVAPAAPNAVGSELTAAAVAEAEDNEDEIIIAGNYNKVALAMDDIKIDWKDTWGKIMGVAVSIKNTEAGTILPEYIIMTVEGYDDFEKRINFPSELKTIKKGVTKKAMLNVPSGFAYNPATVGDLSSVEVYLVLFDQQGKSMATFKQAMNLQR